MGFVFMLSCEALWAVWLLCCILRYYEHYGYYVVSCGLIGSMIAISYYGPLCVSGFVRRILRYYMYYKYYVVL